MALFKNEMHKYIEQIEADLAKFKDSAPFSVGYYSKSEKLSLFLDVLFKDQGFNVLTLDCQKLYSKALPDADEPPRLAQALANLMEQCKTLNKPVIILNNGNYVKNHPIDHDLMIAILKQGINIRPKMLKRGEDGRPYYEDNPQFVPVVMSSCEPANWLYMEHMANTHKFSSKVLNSHGRLKKLWDAQQADDILNQLSAPASLTTEALNNHVQPVSPGPGVFVIDMKSDVYASFSPLSEDNHNSAKVEEKIAKMKDYFLGNTQSNKHETPKN